jgi:hypothetical protein
MRTITPLTLAAVACALLFSSTADAVALGNVASQSSLGQPLKVVIPVALVGGETLNNACLRLVNDGMHEGAPQLVAGRINLDRGGNNPRLLVTTARSVSEPALRFSVQAGCDSTIRRDYVLLFDLPETQRSIMLASANSDEFAQYVRGSRPAVVAGSRRVQSSPAASAAAVSARAAPDVPAPANFARISPTVDRAVAVVPIPSAAPTTALASSPRDLVTLVADNGNSGGLIAQASAQSLPRVTISLPRIATQAPPSEWAGGWLYAVAAFAIIILGLTAFSMRRRMFQAPSWASSARRGEPLNSNTAATPDVTFAHFGVMTEPAPIDAHAGQAFPAMDVPTTEDRSLDTLLGDIRADVIDEQAMRDAWKTAASESAVDLGSDSILKAIAAAEKEMHAGPPSAIDRSLEEDLFRDLPRRRAGGR